MLLPLCLLLTSCPARRTGHALGVLTRVDVPAAVVGRLFVVEALLDAQGPYRFLVDSGSTLSLVTPRLAALARREGEASVSAQTSEGDRVQLERVVLPRVSLGDATFVELPAGVHRFDDLSHQLGITIDGVLGISAFRDVLLTLDYPGRRVRIDPHGELVRGRSDTRDAYFGAGVPLTSVRIGSRSVVALIDSGSDGALAIDSADRVPLSMVPRSGALRATLAGDRPSWVSRADADLQLGDHVVRRPVVELTRGLPAIGGQVLAEFAVTFDQRRELVAFMRRADEPVAESPRRSLGLSFVRAADHWRVASVLPDASAAGGVAVGDECVQIDGEPVAQWPIDRLESELRVHESLTLTFREGAGVREVAVPVFDLVP